MGTCLSKKTTPATINSTTTVTDTQVRVKANPEPEKNKTAAVAAIAAPSTAKEHEVHKKEIFVIKHRKSHEIDRHPDQENPKLDKKKNPAVSPATTDGSQSSTSTVAAAAAAVVSNGESGKGGGAMVRTSSCTKEEVDAILIQCGRLSRSSSTGKAAASENPSRGRRYSGSKRSFDFDLEMDSKNDCGSDDGDGVAVDDGGHRRHRQREPRVSSPSSSRRRSRERDQQQQRSGSKERGSGNGGGRRVSRSPNRRSESPIPNSNGGGNAVSGGSNRPGKMVSVPATDKSNNAGGGEAVAGSAGGVKRIQVKRNVGEVSAAGSRSTASPRSRSPARAHLKVLNENQNQEQRQLQPLSLSRSNSRKAEQSPYRRNPLAEIDNNAAAGSEQQGNKAQMHKPNGEKNKGAISAAVPTKNGTGKEHQIGDEVKVTVVPSGTENSKLYQNVARSRSSRLSRDLDINPETLLNPNPPSYASLLLEDIQNFHQKGTTPAAATTAPPAFSLPACVSKACSILEAVADLNSTTSSNNISSSVFSEDRRNAPMTTDHQVKRDYPVVESEMVVNDDLMEPSLHKYVTVRRGVGAGADTEELESSGSNSFAGSQQLNWLAASSSWEPNSADSTDCWTSSSRSNARENDLSPLGGCQKNGVTESARQQKRELADYPRNGIGRGRLGSHGRSAYSLPNNTTTAAST